MSLDTAATTLFGALLFGMLLAAVALLVVVGVVVWLVVRRQLAGGGSLRYIYGNAPTRTTEATLSQERHDGEVTMSLADVASVQLEETSRPAVTVGNFERSASAHFYVVRVDDRHGGSIYIERLVTSWTIWGTRLEEQGSPVRTILRDLLPRLSPDAEIDPRVGTYAATGKLA